MKKSAFLCFFGTFLPVFEVFRAKADKPVIKKIFVKKFFCVEYAINLIAPPDCHRRSLSGRGGFVPAVISPAIIGPSGYLSGDYQPAGYLSGDYRSAGLSRRRPAAFGNFPRKARFVLLNGRHLRLRLFHLRS